MKIVFFGGCNEIGLNMTAFEENGNWIIVDCGVMFPDDTLPGIDVIRPDATWLTENKISPKAWIITHGHEDHIGALPALLRQFPAPIYCSRVTAEFVGEKLKESDLKNVKMKVVDSFRAFDVAPFRITPIGLQHSIPEAFGFFIETSSGGVFMTGDFRFESPHISGPDCMTEWRKFFSKKKTKVMLCDSTNAKSSGKDRIEDDLVDEFLAIMRESKGSVTFVSFASNLWRFRSVLQAARTAGRKVVPFGRSVSRGFDIGIRSDLLREFADVIVEMEDAQRLEKRKLCVVASGSQGEAFSGATRLALGESRDLRLGKGDVVVFSARTIPGNERNVDWMQEQFARRGVEVITQADRLVHVSGHAFADDIRDCLDVVRPRYFVPVHGDFLKRMSNAAIARKFGIPEERCLLVDNGAVLEVSSKGAQVGAKPVPVGRVFVNEGVVISPEAVRERQKLARAGVIFVSLCIDAGTLQLGSDPECVCRGVPWDPSEVVKICRRAFDGLTKSRKQVPSGKKKKGEKESLSTESIRLAIRRAIESRKDGFRTNVAVVIHWN